MQAALVMLEGCSLGTWWMSGKEGMPEMVVRGVIEGMARCVSQGEVDGIGAPFRVREEVMKRGNSEIMEEWVNKVCVHSDMSFKEFIELLQDFLKAFKIQAKLEKCDLVLGD